MLNITTTQTNGPFHTKHGKSLGLLQIRSFPHRHTPPESIMEAPDRCDDASPLAVALGAGSYIPLTFPFVAAELPAPLPTMQEIFASDDVLPCIFNKRSIRRVGQHFIVKHGEIKLDEAENMHFVAEHTNGKVLVPKLYAAFHDDKTDSNFIIMELVQGKSLEELWGELGADGRTRVAESLKEMFGAIRTIPSQGYYGRLANRAFDDIFLGSDTLPCGPFDTEAELNDAFLERYKSLHPELSPGRGEFYRHVVFPAIMKGHKPVFTHGDLQAKNIIIRSGDGKPCIIDWECSAWYPSYWEYTNSLWTSRRWSDDWFRFVGEFLDTYVVEFKCMETLLGDLLDAAQPGV